jgi:hypothetical protein
MQSYPANNELVEGQKIFFSLRKLSDKYCTAKAGFLLYFRGKTAIDSDAKIDSLKIFNFLGFANRPSRRDADRNSICPIDSVNQRGNYHSILAFPLKTRISMASGRDQTTKFLENNSPNN